LREQYPKVHAAATYVWVVEAAPTPASSSGEVSAAEGRELLRLHRTRERNRMLVSRKNRSVLFETGRLACEACGFDFASVYVALGDGFAECHHDCPLASAAGERRIRLSELSVVCANCHRMLHRRPWHTVAELRELLRSRRSLES
jgi:5-methylcytosine-specific restriction protein A